MMPALTAERSGAQIGAVNVIVFVDRRVQKSKKGLVLPQAYHSYQEGSDWKV